jgi:hypothetical protein
MCPVYPEADCPVQHCHSRAKPCPPAPLRLTLMGHDSHQLLRLVQGHPLAPVWLLEVLTLTYALVNQDSPWKLALMLTSYAASPRTSARAPLRQTSNVSSVSQHQPGLHMQLTLPTAQEGQVKSNAGHCSGGGGGAVVQQGAGPPLTRS